MAIPGHGYCTLDATLEKQCPQARGALHGSVRDQGVDRRLALARDFLQSEPLKGVDRMLGDFREEALFDQLLAQLSWPNSRSIGRPGS